MFVFYLFFPLFGMPCDLVYVYHSIQYVPVGMERKIVATFVLTSLL